MVAGQEARKRAVNYYKQVEEYHHIAEESHANVMVGPELLLQYVDTSGLILDVAGGTGFNAELLKIEPRNYICIDLSPIGLAMVREKRRGSAIQADVSRLPLRDNIVDVVLCSWSLEHFPNPEVILQEMVRVVQPGGRIVIWGPNWDNIFRKDFPQFAHKSGAFVAGVRWKIFLKMIRNEFFPFRYKPFTTGDVVAFVDSNYVACDSDATHCVLCQETYKFFRERGCRVLFMADFADMQSYLRNDLFIRAVRWILKLLLPVLRCVPLLRWFIIRFPIVAEKIQS
jgi:SAM-dependent methyltransferase